MSLEIERILFTGCIRTAHAIADAVYIKSASVRNIYADAVGMFAFLEVAIMQKMNNSPGDFKINTSIPERAKRAVCEQPIPSGEAHP